MKTPLQKPSNPNFSSGPTRKPDGWSVNKLNLKFLGRYHRSLDVRDYIEKIILKIKKTLNIPKDHKVFFFTWFLHRSDDFGFKFYTRRKKNYINNL